MRITINLNERALVLDVIQTNVATLKAAVTSAPKAQLQETRQDAILN